MQDIDIEKLLTEVSTDAPCGGGRLFELDQLRHAAMPKQPPMNAPSQTRAEPPEWPKVLEFAIDLLSRSKDIEIAGILCLALTKINGLDGLVQGLTLMRRLLEQYWACMYPEIDPEKGLEFRNIALEYVLARRKQNPDEETLLDTFDGLALVKSPSFGSYCLNDIDAAKGNTTESKENHPVAKLSDIRAALRQIDEKELAATLQRLESCASEVDGIYNLYREKGETEESLKLLPLKQRVTRAKKSLEELAGIEQANSPQGDKEVEQNLGGSVALANEIVRSREDVIVLLNRICVYYEKYEPSSPVPILLERAKKLVSMSFLEIVKDLVPKGTADAEVFRGRDPSEKDSH